MNILEYVMLNSEASANYIPPKYAVMAASVGGSIGATNVWLQCVSCGIDTEANLEIYLSNMAEVWRNNTFTNEAAFLAAKAGTTPYTEPFPFRQKEVVLVGNTGPDTDAPAVILTNTGGKDQYGDPAYAESLASDTGFGSVSMTGRKVIILIQGTGVVEGTDWEYKDSFTQASSIKGTIGAYSVHSLSDLSTYIAPRHVMNGAFPIG